MGPAGRDPVPGPRDPGRARKGAIVGDELAAQWQAALPSVELAMIADAGHDLWSRDVDAYLAVLLPFLESVR